MVTFSAKAIHKLTQDNIMPLVSADGLTLFFVGDEGSEQAKNDWRESKIKQAL